MTASSRTIDCQWHWYPTEFCEARLGSRSYPKAERVGDGYQFAVTEHETLRVPREYHDITTQHARMHEARVGAVVCSPVVLGDVTGLELAEATEVTRMLQEEFAQEQEARPGEFYGLTALPLQDTAAAISALEYGICELGLAGVLLHSNVNGGSAAAQELWPVYERIAQLGVPVFLHPTRSFQVERIRDYRLERPLMYMYDTSLAAMSLVVAGVLDAFPTLKVVHPHVGGTLPYLAARLEEYRRRGFWDLEEPIETYLRRFFTDSVSGSPAAFKQAVDLYGLDHMLFASDFPYFRADEAVEFVESQLGAGQRDAVMYENALKLLDRGRVEVNG